MTEYLRYVIQNEEPLRIADDSVRQSGQTETLCYIPGSTIRGFVINEYAKKYDLEKEFGRKKNVLGDQLSFLNAYPTTNEHTLIPSPKGFYEDKVLVEGPKELPVNVVIKGEDVGGRKRASLGRFCYIENGCIHYYSVKTDADMKIRINIPEDEPDEAKVFRNTYICPGHCFEGFIALRGSEETDEIARIFEEGRVIQLGNARSSGMGKCRIIQAEKIANLPYAGEGFEQEKECYLMLLSNTTMRGKNGEVCGLNTVVLEEELGVTELKVEYCSTSVKQISGYNRTWGARVPSLLTYEAGSVFHLTFNGVISKERMESVMDKGIGVRRSEGFGRVLFLENYEQVKYKLACDYKDKDEREDAVKAAENEASNSDRETIRTIARAYYKNVLDRAMEKYVVETPLEKGNLKNSQLGTISSSLTSFRYDSKKARASLDADAGNASDKEGRQNVQKETESRIPLIKQFMNIMDTRLPDTLEKYDPVLKEEKIMGIDTGEFFSKEEEELYKLGLIIQMIRYDRKGE